MARSLGESLAASTPEQLSTLLRLRPDLVQPPAGDLGEVARRALSAPSVARALDQLDAWRRTVALALAASPDGVGVGDLHPLLAAGTAEDVARAVADLRSAALLWGDDDELHLVRTAREAFGPYPGGLAPVSTRAVDAAQLEQAVADADPAERKVLERLLWESPVGAVRTSERPVSLAEARTPIERLLARGLLRAVDAETVVLPREVSLVLRQGRLTRDPVRVTPPEPSESSRPAGLVERAAVGAAWAIVHDVEQLVADLERREVGLLRDGGMSSRDVVGLGRRAALDAEAAAVALEWAGASGLVAADGPRLLPTPAFDRWVDQPGADRWLHLVRCWRDGERWPLTGARGHVLGEDGRLRGAAEIRATVLGVLAEQPVGRQVAAAELTALVAWRRPTWPERLDLPQLVADLLVEAEQAGLTALGAVTSLLGVGLGGELSESQRAEFPEPVERLIIQADLTAVAPGPLRAEVARELALLAEQESRGGGGVYRFTAGSLRRAFDAGWSLPQVERWLREHSDTGVPQPLEYLLNDVARRHGSIRVTPVLAVLRCEDPTQATSLLTRPEARTLGLQELAPGVLGASVEPDELVRVLRGLGLAPIATDATGMALASPAPPRARDTGDRPPPATPDVLDTAVRLLAQEQDRRSRARALDGAVDVLTRAAASGTTVVVEWTDPDGGACRERATPLSVTAGAVRLSGPAGRVLTVPLARVVAASEA